MTGAITALRERRELGDPNGQAWPPFGKGSQLAKLNFSNWLSYALKREDCTMTAFFGA